MELLKKEHIPADEMLAALEEYSIGPWEQGQQYETKGLVKLHPGLSKLYIIASLSSELRSATNIYLDVHDLTYGKTKLQQKVVATLRKAENRLRIAHLRAANTATMADQQPLPAFTAPSSVPAPSLHGISVSDNLGPVTSDGQAQKVTSLSVPVKLGSLPFVGGKRVVKEDVMDVDE